MIEHLKKYSQSINALAVLEEKTKQAMKTAEKKKENRRNKNI